MKKMSAVFGLAILSALAPTAWGRPKQDVNVVVGGDCGDRIAIQTTSGQTLAQKTAEIKMVGQTVDGCASTFDLKLAPGRYLFVCWASNGTPAGRGSFEVTQDRYRYDEGFCSH